MNEKKDKWIQMNGRSPGYGGVFFLSTRVFGVTDFACFFYIHLGGVQNESEEPTKKNHKKHKNIENFSTETLIVTGFAICLCLAIFVSWLVSFDVFCSGDFLVSGQGLRFTNFSPLGSMREEYAFFSCAEHK